MMTSISIIVFAGKILEKTPVTTDEDNLSNAITAYQFSAELSLWLFTEECKPTSLRKAQETISHRCLPKFLMEAFWKPAQLELQRG